MPLMLICSCGHSAPLPENSGNYVCSKCKAAVELAWFGYRGKTSPVEQFHGWRLRTGRVANPTYQAPRIEFVPETA